MKYTVKDLRVDFPDEEACLEWLINWRYPEGVTCKKCDKVTKHYKDKNRRSYSCSECGNHTHPAAGTICHNSHIPLPSAFEFYREDSYTQNIENVWSTMKPRWKGTFKHISPKYLQAYANEFAWRYNHRNDVSMFWSLMDSIDR